MIKSRINFVILLLIVVMVMAGAALAFQNEPSGFRGLEWGDPPVEGMISFSIISLSHSYELPDEKLALGAVSLYMILYEFFIRGDKEVFAGAGLYFKGEENYDRMERICKEKFGEPTKTRYNGMTWNSSKSIVILQYDIIEERGWLALHSMPLSIERTKALKKLEAEKAKGDW